VSAPRRHSRSPASPSAEGPFGRRGARWLAAIAATSLVASAVLAVFADAFEVPSYGADSFSRSAIGHHAFVRLLRDLGRTVIVSRSRTAEKAPGAVLLLLEPMIGPAGLDDRSRERLGQMLEAGERVLLVLPKRTGFPERTRPRWLGGTALLPEALPDDVLRAARLGGHVARPAASIGSWTGGLPAPELAEPQLIRGGVLDPVLATDEGILVGEKIEDGAQLLVLADPDVLATHGLGRGANAELAVALLDRLDPTGSAAVVLDETLHGHEVQPSLARELLRWPLVLATLQAALALALVAWAALVRFGRPQRMPPALAPGKDFLVENTADLLRHGGHVGPALAAYWRAAREQIAHALRPPGERSGDLERWLRGLAAARGRAERLAALEGRVAALSGRRGHEEEALRAALDVHAFREEMTHGAGADP